MQKTLQREEDKNAQQPYELPTFVLENATAEEVREFEQMIQAYVNKRFKVPVNFKVVSV